MSTPVHPFARSWLPALALAVAVGCSPYGDPDLGNAPFRCGTDEPRCPRGYVCVTHSPVQEICEKASSVAGPDAGFGSDSSNTGFVCNNDSSLEPNNSIAQATVTPIPNLGREYELLRLAICPDSDVDVFRFGTDQPQMHARARITYNSSQGVLQLDILNNSGASIREATPVGGNPDILEAEVNFIPLSTYFAQVKSSGPGIQNNYDLRIVVSGP
jgi:hypothetical protein